MKVAIFHNLPSGGAKRALYEFSKELQRRGFLLDAFIPSTANEEFLPLDEVVHRKFVYPVKLFPPSIDLMGFRWMHHKGLLLSHVVNQKHIASEINNRDYALAFVHHSIITQSPFILRYLRIPSLYYIQEPLRFVHEHRLIAEPIPLSFRRSFLLNVHGLFSNALIKSIDESNTLHASRILVNSSYSHESVMRAYGVNSYVSYLGVDAERFRPDENTKKENMVLSVGSISQFKGFRFILKAMGKLRSKPRLVIIGDRDNHDERTVLTALAGENHVDMEIKVGVSDSELIGHYNKAMMTVYAPYLEPFGFVPLEAMACGTPVIGVGEGGVRESIVNGTTGMIVERDPDKFADAIEYLMQSPDKRRSMGKNAIEFVRERWTWEKATDNLVAHFDAVLRKG
ncbi:MAG: glycosyltransferase family 4 protein [Deltaproteobacteria bacterium]|nr:glycosyltransferase family 4 protein [Deltaproteobacteria bacterium]MCL5277428.1 glycosyltransferase family 4 protein [Deltaproteobacteria bacterium]